MKILRLLCLALLVTPLLAEPALAAGKQGAAKLNTAATKQLCADLKDILQVTEAEADKRAGTKAAKPYAEQADRIWADGAKNKCNWAQ